MELNQCKARFSLAYIGAVAARAGYQVCEPVVDDDSVDGILIGQAGRRPRIEFQAKASSRQLLQEQHLAFPLSIKNYNDLRAEVIVPRLLIVVLVPEQQDDWLHHSEEQLCLRHCGYWLSLAGQPDTENGTTVTVYLPRHQRFDSEALHAQMTRAERGEPL